MRIIPLLLFILLLCTQPVLAEEDIHPSSDTLPPTIKILGGIESKQGDWPWMTAILRSTVTNMYQAQFCAGVLIDKNWVLTAAHCVEDESTSTINVAVGVFDLNTFSGGRISVSSIRIHPDYDTNNIQNDIALLQLSSPSSQQIISLFSGKSTENVPPSLLGRMLTAMGWGEADSNTGLYFPEKLRQVNLPVVDNRFCDYPLPFTSSQLCAGYTTGKDACRGDSGGPVVHQIDGVWVHTGLVSYGVSCDKSDGWYGVYTRTSAFVDFIKQYVPNAQFTSAGSTPEGTKTALSWLQLLLLSN
ncbi:MAG: serine protease [Desulfocapsa sp.]|nr:serine protease [Desulfocapsa sp.]MBN4048612.1 serine protease [bacterium AH-315-N22]